MITYTEKITVMPYDIKVVYGPKDIDRQHFIEIILTHSDGSKTGHSLSISEANDFIEQIKNAIDVIQSVIPIS